MDQMAAGTLQVRGSPGCTMRHRQPNPVAGLQGAAHTRHGGGTTPLLPHAPALPPKNAGRPLPPQSVCRSAHLLRMDASAHINPEFFPFYQNATKVRWAHRSAWLRRAVTAVGVAAQDHALQGAAGLPCRCRCHCGWRRSLIRGTMSEVRCKCNLSRSKGLRQPPRSQRIVTECLAAQAKPSGRSAAQ